MTKTQFALCSWIAAIICLVLFLVLSEVHAVFALLSIFFCALGLFIGLTIRDENF